MASYLNHHFFDPVTRFLGDARDVGGTCGYISRKHAVKYDTLLARQRLNCTPV